MLINFYFENFRSLYDKSVLSMQKGSKRELEETIINKKIKGKEYSLLPNKVIYGVNAAGKTSLILAMEMFKEIIVNGNITSPKDDSILNDLPICRFLHEKEKLEKPMIFGICFLFHERKYEYELKIDSDENNLFELSVLYEKLIIDDILIFERNKNKIKFNPKNSTKFMKYVKMTPRYMKETENMLKNNLDTNSIFIKWFNFDKIIISDIVNWFNLYFNIFTNVDNINYTPKINSKDKLTVIFNKAIREMTKEADFGPQKIEFVEKKVSETQSQTYLQSSYEIKGIENLKIKVMSEVIESLGTMKLIKFFAPFLNTILLGGVIIVDELDSSIHPEVIASIINTFNDPLVNVNGGQLIFTTHNPVFLNKYLLRRDEIVFVEKDPNTYISEINTLDDFNIKIDEKYLKNYLDGKYINFANINFSAIIKKAKEEIANNEETN